MDTGDGDAISETGVMTLAVLLSAQASAVGVGEEAALAALLPVAGMTVIERQAAAAMASGARLALILVDTVPTALAAALDRVRAQGMRVQVVRDAADMCGHAGGIDRLLLVADGLLAPRSAWSTVAAATGSTILAVADVPATAALERIDAGRRWAGLAIVPAGALSALADLPDEWDPQLALLRGAIQNSATVLTCAPELFERGDLALVDTASAAELVELRLLAAGTSDAAGLVHAGVLMPAARAVVRAMLRGSRGGVIARVLQSLGGVGALVAMVLGFPALATASALTGLTARAMAVAIATFRPERPVWAYAGLVGDYAGLAALLVAGWVLGGNGLIFTLSLALTLVLIERLSVVLHRAGVANSRWIPDTPLIWLIFCIAQSGGFFAGGLAAAPPLVAILLAFACLRAENPNAV